MLRDCGKGCVYSVLVIFGVISLSFPISIVKGILRAYATRSPYDDLQYEFFLSDINYVNVLVALST